MARRVPVFSYGSNLCIDRMLLRTPGAQVTCVGFVEGYDLRFHKAGVDGSAKADCFQTDDASDRVWGAVYEISPREKSRLDRYESLGVGYFEKQIEVYSGDGQGVVRAWVYVANPAQIDPGMQPYSWYHRFVVVGARQHGIEPDYRRRLDAVTTMEDPDRHRHRRQWDIIKQEVPRNE